MTPRGNEKKSLTVGVIGSGRFGTSVAAAFSSIGAQVALVSLVRGSRAVYLPGAGVRLRTTTIQDPVLSMEVVVFAFAWKARDCLWRLKPAGDPIVIDATNPTFGQSYKRPAALDTSSGASSRALARMLPGLRIVKALNTVSYLTLLEVAAGAMSRRVLVPVSGEDPQARGCVIRILRAIQCDGIDCGTLAEGARLHEPGGPLFSDCLVHDEIEPVLRARDAGAQRFAKIDT